MERGKVLSKAKSVPLDLIRGIREALQRRENTKYGTPEQRRQAYSVLHTTFKTMFGYFGDEWFMSTLKPFS